VSPHLLLQLQPACQVQWARKLHHAWSSPRSSSTTSSTIEISPTATSCKPIYSTVGDSRPACNCESFRSTRICQLSLQLAICGAFLSAPLLLIAMPTTFQKQPRIFMRKAILILHHQGSWNSSRRGRIKLAPN
jgi:hypothetical protein